MSTMLVRELPLRGSPLGEVVPRPEYPQPQFQRSEWLNLNGDWEFAFDDSNAGLEENWAAAAERSKQPLLNWAQDDVRVLGPQPSQGVGDAFRFALSKGEVRAADYAASIKGMSITNASTKFKQLWENGFLLRRETTAESGGVEFVYVAIR